MITIRYPDGEVRWWNATTGQPIGKAILGNGETVRFGAMFQHRPNPFQVTLRFRTESGNALEVEPTVWDPSRESPVRLRGDVHQSQPTCKTFFMNFPCCRLLQEDESWNLSLEPMGNQPGGG